MNKVEFTEQTIYEEIYDSFLKELEKTLDIKLSNKVKEKNNKLFQVLSNFSWENFNDLVYYLFERNYSCHAMLSREYILDYINEYKCDIEIWKKLIGLYFKHKNEGIIIDRVLFVEKTTFISKKMDKVRWIAQKYLEKILVWEWV